jgi:hypothetical protein
MGGGVQGGGEEEEEEEEDTEPSCSLSLFEAAILESAEVEHQQKHRKQENAKTARDAVEEEHQGETIRGAAGASSSPRQAGAEVDVDSETPPVVAAADVIMCTGGLVWSTAFCPALPRLPPPAAHPHPQHTQHAQPQPQNRKRKAGTQNHQQSQQTSQQQQQPSAAADDTYDTLVPPSAEGDEVGGVTDLGT